MEYKTLTISTEQDLGVIQSRLFGTNLEHTRGSVYGGLSAQMLKNRKFVGCPTAMEGVAVEWYLIGGDSAYGFFHYSYTHHDREHYHMYRQNECNAQGVMNLRAGQLCGIGQHEMVVTKGRSYDVAVVARSDTPLTLTAAITDRWGGKVYAQATWSLPQGDEWTRYTACLTPDVDDGDADLRVTFEEEGTVQIGCVSLMDHNNFRGMRVDAVESLKEMGIRVLRWPGGNFAGEYNWFDGLLPVDERAPFESHLNLETQPHSLGYDFHEINTDDFVALCREVGAEPYITINPVWNTAEESAAWVEYCNGDENTTYGKLRIERGFAEPYNVKLWSLGNEMGYGHMEGDKTPAGYARLARKNAEAMLAVCPDLELCSSGPHPNEDWIRDAVKPLEDVASLVSLHTYINFGSPSFAYTKKGGLADTYRRHTHGVEEARQLARHMRSAMGDCSTRISFDEWNIWHAWRRPSCVIDGMFTAGMLHMFIDEMPKLNIGVCCQFELINESGVKITPTEAILSATGQAFSIMKPHCGGILRYATDEVVASEQDGVMTVTIINFSVDEAVGYCLNCGDAILEATLFEGKSLRPHSYFEPSELAVEDGKVEIPAHSVARVRYQTK